VVKAFLQDVGVHASRETGNLAGISGAFSRIPMNDSTEYPLGHSDGELARLEQQGSLFAEATRTLLLRAGLAPGMNILDVGCGVGDVSLVAADIVGPSGSVTGIDSSAQALAIARRRGASVGNWLRFEEADIPTLQPTARFDAVIGRFILLYMRNPAAVLARLSTFVRPNGIVAFIEMDICGAKSVPRLPLFDQGLAWITELYRRSDIEPDMGSLLFSAFRHAGLKPSLHALTRVEGGPDARVYDYLADTLRSLLQSLEQANIATAEQIGLDTLADRVRSEALAADTCFIYPRIVGAWARTAP
jgi:ubiquinone/menaquinone biosynthesis C-methylase UbiE